MKTKIALAAFAIACFLGGCNFSPLSPSNRQNIRNNGDVGDIKNNQQGIMAEIMSLKNRMDIMASEIENIQNGFINHNNKNNGVQIFQGDGGLLVGLGFMAILAMVAMNYKIKSDKYKKTAELFGNQIKKMNNSDVEKNLLTKALAEKIETEAFGILKSDHHSKS